MHPNDKKMVRAAKRLHHDEGNIEIDDNARVSRAEGNPERGAYVEAWVWVEDDDCDSRDNA